MRYLQSDLLRKNNLEHFDSWAATFGETQTSMELAPEGGGYRARTRFAKFFNLPELMTMFKDCADIKTADMLPDLKVPDVTFHNVVVQPTEHQKEMVADLSEHAKLVQQKAVPPERDNMLCITNDGRKIGLDQRLMNPLLPDEPGTKVNACIDNVHKIWTDTAAQKSAQLIFCDFSTPKNDGKFNIYDDIRDKLVARRVPKNEVAFIHEYDSEGKKKELFAKVHKGDIRVLIGSTAKCGSGTNIQNKLIALHDLDVPWRPADLEQRLDRIKRQGNENPAVSVYRYVTENTFDAYLYQTLENKQRYISQIMTSKSPVRSCEDVDEATLSYAEVKALCAGNPLIKEKIDLDVSVAKLKALKANHVNEQYRLEDNVLKFFPEAIRKTENRIKGYESDSLHLKLKIPPAEGILPMTVLGETFTNKEAAGKALIEACKQLKSKETLDIGTYKGFDLSLSYDSFDKTFHLEMKCEMTYSTTLGTDPHGNITRVNNALDNIPKMLENSQSQLEALKSQLDTARTEFGKPFPREEELQTKLSRLTELNIQLNIEGKQEIEAPTAEPKAIDKSDVAAEKSIDKPPKSIHDKMKFYKEISDKQNGDKPPKLGKNTELQ